MIVDYKTKVICIRGYIGSRELFGLFVLHFFDTVGLASGRVFGF